MKRVLALTLCYFGYLILLLSLTNCRSTPDKKEVAAATNVSAQESSDLSLQEAEARKTRLANVQYTLQIQLEKQGKEFSGTEQVTFDLSDNSQPLRLDFFEGQVAALKVNGQAVSPDSKKKFWLELPAAQLKKGANTVEIAYTHEYSHQGQGLHQFVDPETKEVFLYTQFETFDANRFMPCFDQPDLRARLTLTVNAPANWQVISTTRESNIKTLTDNHKQWTFPQTEPIATYLFSLHAGPFKVWTDQFEDIPLRLFARPSMAKYVDSKEWFKWTKEGLKFYNTYFAYKYPFKKYDQIIVPDFNAGAMENVAAITFSETYLSRSSLTRIQKRNLASTIMHEMAHMWFGDIVTMKWWNNLWLNESFATFMAALCMDQATEFKESWQDFFAGEKNWAYWEDGLVTTHPIEAPINTVKDAFANFDGITYGKGASVLKELWAYMSPEKFQKGIQQYIHTYAFKNADLQDFIGSLQAQTDKNLTLWASRWLRQSGADKISAKWKCDGDKLHSLELTSSPKKDAQFRPQALKVGLFPALNGQLGEPSVVRVDMTQATQTVSGDWNCPAFVYPNFQDETYTQVSLDPISLEFAKKHLSQMSDALLRTMVWSDLWQMVRDTEMPLNEYVQTVNTHFPGEKDEILLEEIVSTIAGRHGDRATILHYWPQVTAQAQAYRLQFVAKMEDQFLKRIHEAKLGSDEQKFWFDSFVQIAQSPKALAQLAKWANGKKDATGFNLDLDRRWHALRQLSRYDYPGTDKLIVEMKKKDSSDRGQKNLLSAEAIQPKLSVKQKWVDIVKQPKPTVPFADVRAVLSSLFPVEQEALARNFATDYYDYLTKNGASEDEIYVEHVASSMAPLSCSEKESSRMRQFLTSTRGFTPTVTRALKIDLQEDERCQRIRAFSAL